MKASIEIGTRSDWRPASLRSLKASVYLSILALTTLMCVNASAQPFSIKRSNDPISQTPAIKENFVTVGTLRVHYVESGTGPAVVLIHGNAGNIEDFEFGLIQALSANYRVVAIDRPGHGKSDRPTATSATVEYQARLMHLVLSSLGVERPILIGHSWGAALALSYVLQYPEDLSAMILVAPAAYPDTGENRLVRAVTRLPVLGDMTLMAGR